jgi:AbrB family looped-hinge helix DNA binding protein
MARITSKLQVTIPKALADRTGLRAGDDIEWAASNGGLRITPAVSGALSAEMKLDLFDRATERQKRRERSRRARSRATAGRGGTRSELYNRGRSR